MNKLLYLTCLVMALPYSGHSQTDTVYFDHKWEVTSRANAEYYRLRTNEPGGFKAEDHYMKNGNLQMTGHLIVVGDSNLRNGDFVYYYEDGSKSSEGEFKHENRIGLWKYYNDSGLTSENRYENDKLEGTSVYYYSGGKTVWYTENYKDNKSDGELKSFYKTGKIKRKEYHTANSKEVTGKCYNEQGKEIPFTPFEQMPESGYNLMGYLSNNLKYPEKDRRKNVEGRVIVKFVVYEDGSINDVTVIQHVSKKIDAEAVRVIRGMPKWKPGVQDDKIVKVYFTQPITFKLED